MDSETVLSAVEKGAESGKWAVIAAALQPVCGFGKHGYECREDG